MKPALEIYRPPSKQLYLAQILSSWLDFSLLSDIRLDLPQNKLNVHAQEFTMNMQRGLELQRFAYLKDLNHVIKSSVLDRLRTFSTRPVTWTRFSTQSPAAACTNSYKWPNTIDKFCSNCSSSNSSEWWSNRAHIRCNSALAWRFINHRTCH